MCRICLKNGTSVLVKETYEEVLYMIRNFKYDFIEVTNNNTNTKELYNRDFIWCIRKHREEDSND